MSPGLNAAYFTARPTCPVCGGTDAPEIYRNALTASPVRDYIASHYERQGAVDWSMLEGTDYVLCACRDCKLVYQRNAPNGVLLDRLYNQTIAPQTLQALEEERLTVDNFNQIAGEMDALFRLAGKHPSKVTFLDYGFGHGRWARVARALGAKVFATETGEDKKAYAATLGVEVVDDADLDHMRFDIVHTEQVFEHLTDPALEFRRLAKATQGIMKFAVPYHRDIPALIAAKGMASKSPFSDVLSQGGRMTQEESSYFAVLPLEHLNAYAPQTVERLARDNAMHVVSSVRRGSVALNVSDLGLFAKSLMRAGAMVAKSALAPNRGYHLLAPGA